MEQGINPGSRKMKTSVTAPVNAKKTNIAKIPLP